MILSSPDQRYALALEPEPESYSKWWRISCTSDDENWYAQFGGNTPVEILAGFTDALLSPAPETAPDVWPILTAAGWTHVQDERGHEVAEHPDGIMQLRRWNTASSWDRGWNATALLPDGLGRVETVWEAYLGNAPISLPRSPPRWPTPLPSHGPSSTSLTAASSPRSRAAARQTNS